jgi:daunorubicin resistance ABC transporter ATP-binding subunit
MTVMRQAIETVQLRKRFGTTVALQGVDLSVPQGIVYGLLGPNGAGKTTMVRILATLIRPDSGRAWVAGKDIVAAAAEVRRAIGLTGQYAALDEALTGEENLVLIGRLHRLPSPEAHQRAAELLEVVGLTEVAKRPVRTYSGGMRRRVDLAASLAGRPEVLVLDEPTAGLDPASRLALWELVEGLVRDGTTVLLTTQYLEEVDRLAARIAVLDRGHVIAEGTTSELKAMAGGQVIAARVGHGQTAVAIATLAPLATGELRVESGEVVVPVSDSAALADAVLRLRQAGIQIDELALRGPTLDEVFLRLTRGTNEREPVLEVV